MTKTSKGSAAGAYQSVGKTYDGVTILKPKTKPKNVTTAQVRATLDEVVGNLFVEQRADGGYAVRREGGKRASAVVQTQREAVAQARELAPAEKPAIKRGRNTKGAPNTPRKI